MISKHGQGKFHFTFLSGKLFVVFINRCGLVVGLPTLQSGDFGFNLLTTTIVAPPSNASNWQMGFNSAFKGLKEWCLRVKYTIKYV